MIPFCDSGRQAPIPPSKTLQSITVVFACGAKIEVKLLLENSGFYAVNEIPFAG
jgi:hypothetical protein